ncbi:hypothetical protein SAMN05192529_103182 [Arachidicoccus rhizosphaerae]|jgi:pimeloyl-ACP methyl ester carboxylesterase|uniref:Serine aminopeptidase S33 domain-containing protein n=1 Tax=Arachidicoccus rhizosphaerae TaxID=551991 RepID=A0A1H3WNT8_9BACT|nr:alpha/beta fold hydrolase [Arachidicoccus rhizosphaerae]SDZ88815.1 hypothetical protein SAMN05192529_103182 [Arachidicoccus rhizosphaerae]
MKLKLVFAIAFIFPILSFAQSAKPKEQQIAKEFVEDIMQERYEKALSLCDTLFKVKVSQSMLQQIRNGLVQQLGSLKNIISTSQQPYKEDQLIILYSQFEKGNLDLKVLTNKDFTVSGFYMAPHKEAYNQATNPNAYDIQSGNLLLPGTLLIPKSDNKHKLVILVHGSGPGDRDETLGQIKPFMDLAEGLLKNGIASYRYDKRTFVNPGSLPADYTIDDEVTTDVFNIIEHFSSNDTFRNYKIYVIGHSLGAMLAPRIAKEAGDKISGIVMMAAPARKLSDIILEQTKYLDSLFPGKEQDEALRMTARQLHYMHSPAFNERSPLDSLLLNQPASYWLSLKSYNQVGTITGLRLPVLILQGEKDYQVRMTDFNIWKQNTKGMSNFTYKSYPGLSHLFMSSNGIPSPKDYQGEKHIPDYVITDLSKWIINQK